MIKDNKITRIILGIALIGIWGIVIYRVVDAMSNKNIPNIAPTTYWIDTLSEQVNQSYELHLGYNDPFLKTDVFQLNQNENISSDVNIPSNSTNVANPTIENLLPTKTKKVAFPTLEYLGLIVNKSTGQELAIIKHKNKIYRIRQNEKIANCSIFFMNKDSIQVSLKGAINTIKR